jgi:hypothetical protein
LPMSAWIIILLVYVLLKLGWQVHAIIPAFSMNTVCHQLPAWPGLELWPSWSQPLKYFRIKAVRYHAHLFLNYLISALKHVFVHIFCDSDQIP